MSILLRFVRRVCRARGQTVEKARRPGPIFETIRRHNNAIHGHRQGQQGLRGGRYAQQEVKSKQEAIEWLKRAPFGGGTEVEIRQVFEAADFGEALTPELREAEERMRKQIAAQKK